MTVELERVSIDTAEGLWAWLAANHRSDQSFLLVTWKKSSPAKYVSRDDVLDALLAFGWIDGRRYAVDEERTMQLICKRKQQKWTQSYRDRIDSLIAKGVMKPSGLAAVNEAKAQGNWLANSDVDDLVCPPDLTQAVKDRNGQRWWDAVAPSYKRNILRWLSSAKKAETRQKRCLEIAEACGAGLKIKNF